MNQDLNNPMERAQLPAAADGLQPYVSAPPVNEVDQQLNEWTLPNGQPPFASDDLFLSDENFAADSESFLANNQSFLDNSFSTQVQSSMAGHIDNSSFHDGDPAEMINIQVSGVNGSRIGLPMQAPQPMTVGQYARNEISIAAKQHESMKALTAMVENLEQAYSQEQQKTAQMTSDLHDCNETVNLLKSALQSHGVDVQAALSKQENQNLRAVDTQELTEPTSDVTQPMLTVDESANALQSQNAVQSNDKGKGRADSGLPISPRNSVFSPSNAEYGNAESVPIVQSNSASAGSTDRSVSGTTLPRAGIDATPNQTESSPVPTSPQAQVCGCPWSGRQLSSHARSGGPCGCVKAREDHYGPQRH